MRRGGGRTREDADQTRGALRTDGHFGTARKRAESLFVQITLMPTGGKP